MPRLDLSGINLTDFTKKRVKRELHISKPTIQVTSRPVSVVPVKPIGICICIILLVIIVVNIPFDSCLLYTSPSPRDRG